MASDAKHYFEVPLARAHRTYETAYKQVSGLGRTARGPSMSATPGKVLVDGVAEVGGERVFDLKLVQARNPEWVGRPFFARYDERATWLDELQPALGASELFFEPELRAMERRAGPPARGAVGRLPRRSPGSRRNRVAALAPGVASCYPRLSGRGPLEPACRRRRKRSRTRPGSTTARRPTARPTTP